MAYKVVISQASKVNPKDRYQVFNQESKLFPTLKKAKAFIKEQYGSKKGQPMYRDTKSGESVRVGTIFGSKGEDYDRDSGKRYHYLQQDWVEIQKGRIKKHDLPEMKIPEKNPVTGSNLVDYITKFEGGSPSYEDVMHLFSYLIKTGQVWSLQGFYGRQAHDFIESGMISKDGTINWDRVEEAREDDFYSRPPDFRPSRKPIDLLSRKKAMPLVQTKVQKLGSKGSGWHKEPVSHSYATKFGKAPQNVRGR